MDVRRTPKQDLVDEVAMRTDTRASTSVAPTNLKYDKSLNRKAPVNKELLKLKFHSGPIDQRALSSREPQALLHDIVATLESMGLIVQTTNDEYKLKVIRPAGTREEEEVQSSDASQRRSSRAFSHNGERRSGYSKFAYMLTSFPVSLVKRIKYLAQFGTQYNSGFDGHSSPETFKNRPQPMEFGEIRFHLMLHRIKNLEGLLIVDVKRLRGDIWQFKALYHEIVPKLSLRGEYV
ncbi:hypothetical protein EDD86DRAFT_141470 [Gorgonomyces haynaldii]|nr:hypothetical protein EDD86DRAFT_141470 [Gorgonomyces haynaldii]